MLFQCFSGALKVQNIQSILKTNASQKDIKVLLEFINPGRLVTIKWGRLVGTRAVEFQNWPPTLLYIFETHWTLSISAILINRTEPLIMIESI